MKSATALSLLSQLAPLIVKKMSEDNRFLLYGLTSCMAGSWKDLREEVMSRKVNEFITEIAKEGNADDINPSSYSRRQTL